MKKIILLLLLVFNSNFFSSVATSSEVVQPKHSFYVDIDKVYPGQLMFSNLTVESCVQRVIDANENKKYNDGTSSRSIDRAKPVILGPKESIILVDGHHTVLALKRLGDSTIPIYIEQDWSNLSQPEFFEKAKANNYIYPYDIEGNLILFDEDLRYDWDLMKNNPNRHFPDIVGLNCSKQTGECTKNPTAIEKPEKPLWKNYDEDAVDLAFIELKMATVLHKAGLYFKDEWGSNPNSKEIKEFTEKARKVLKDALSRNELPQFELCVEENRYCNTQ